MPHSDRVADGFEAVGADIKSMLQRLAILENSNETLVFSMMGQSNIQGRALIGTLPSYLSGTLSTVKIWTGSAWASLQADVNSGYPQASNDFGPEMNLGFLAAALSGKTVYIVKHAEGGTPLVTMTSPTWNPNHASSLWNAAKTELQEALANLTAQGLTPDVVGLWGQGEEDSKTSGIQASYQNAQQQLFTQWRTAANSPNMPIVDMRIRSGNDGTFVARAQINAAKDAVQLAMTNVTQIQTDGFGDIGDSVHYDGAGQLAFGRHTLERGRGLTFPLPSGSPTLVLDLDPSKQEGYTLSAIQTLSQANDLSGNARHFSQATSGNRPSLIEGALTRGFGVMRFTAGKHIAAASSPFITTDTWGCAFVLTNFTNPTAANFRTILTGYAAGTFALAFPSGSASMSLNHPTNIMQSSVAFASGQSYVVLVQYGGAAGSYIDIDGVQTASTTAVSNMGATSQLGINYLNAASFGAYDLARLIAWKGVLTTTQREKITGFLAHRYALTDKLGSGHPYKTLAPV